MYCHLNEVDFCGPYEFLLFYYYVHAAGGWLQTWKVNRTSDTRTCEMGSGHLKDVFSVHISLISYSAYIEKQPYNFTEWASLENDWGICTSIMGHNSTNVASQKTAYSCFALPPKTWIPEQNNWILVLFGGTPIISHIFVFSFHSLLLWFDFEAWSI